MTTYLLDANVLIALTITEHEHHRRASSWIAGAESVALCPVTEGALVRFLLRLGESQRTAKDVLVAMHDRPGVRFWPDAMSYVDADLAHVVGHRQVTDAYLVGLARSHPDGSLATLDEALARTVPQHVTLIPPH